MIDIDSYYDKNVDWQELGNRVNGWTVRAFDALAETKTMYELAVEILFFRKSREQNLKQALTADDSLKLQKQLKLLSAGAKVEWLSEAFVPYGKLKKTLKPLMLKRWFLFQALKREIHRLESHSEIVPDTYRSLISDYQSILETIVNSATRLVPFILNQVMHPDRISEEDLLACGYQGLVIAAHRFDFDRKSSTSDELVKFTTCARLWILERVRDAIYKGYFYLSVDVETREECLRASQGRTADERKVLFGSYAASPYSLEHGYEPQAGTHQFDNLPEFIDNSYSIGSTLLDPEVQSGSWEWAEAAKTIFREHLNELEFKVLVSKFQALSQEPEASEVEIAKELSISYQRVYKLLESAIEKLRSNEICIALLEQLRANP